MKNYFKKILMAVMLMATAAVMAGANDSMVAFATKGGDVYADGTPVQVGECYALVWVRDGFEFAGVDMNGAAVDAQNNAVVAALPLAKAKRNGTVGCPLTLFQINEEFASSHADGSYSLILLDTRVANRSGELVASGNAKQVNGWGFATKSRVKTIAKGMAAMEGAKDREQAQAAQSSAIPAGEEIPQPKITGISVKGGYVYLTVKGTSPRLIYNITAGATPGNLNKRHVATTGVQGHSHKDREITIVTPVTAGQNFFKVVRN